MSSPQIPRPTGVDPTRRRRFRRALAIALLVPLVELVVLIAVAGRVGAGPVLLVVLLSAFAGVAVLRRGTPRAWATLRELGGQGPTPEHHLSRDAQASSGRVMPVSASLRPDPAQGDGGTASNLRATGENLKAVGVDLTEDLLLLVCGIMLVWPGLITTVLGLVLLIPGLRRFLAGRLGRKAATVTTARVERFVEINRVQLSDGVIRGETVDRATFRPESSPSQKQPPTPPQLEK